MSHKNNDEYLENEKEALSEYASLLGKKGGKMSVKNRFKGMSEAEISEYMKKVRKGKPLSSSSSSSSLKKIYPI